MLEEKQHENKSNDRTETGDDDVPLAFSDPITRSLLNTDLNLISLPKIFVLHFYVCFMFYASKNDMCVKTSHTVAMN